MTAALETTGLGKRYRRRWALSDCTVSIPQGRVVGLVGPNGAGKSTLLNLAAGLLRPTAGTIEVLGAAPASSPAQLGRVGFVAQDTPTYGALTVREHLDMGAHLNPTWDHQLAEDRIADLGIDPKARASRLSGGQRAQLALTVAVSKRPELLVLDEPVSSLDPLARREFLQALMDTVADQGVGVIMSSHVVADLERICDHLVLLVQSRVCLADDIEHVLASHRRLTGARDQAGRLPREHSIVSRRMTDRQATVVVRTDEPILDPSWEVDDLSLEDIVLAYMRGDRSAERLQAVDAASTDEEAPR